MTAPAVVAFDVVETLFSLESLRVRLGEAGAGGQILEVWFSRLLRDGFALTAAGDYRDFATVAASTLRSILPDADDAAIRSILDGFAEMTPHPDARPAMERLINNGVRIFTLTNGSESTSATLLERAGLAKLVEHRLSIDAVKAWKPAPAPYVHTAQVAGVRADQLALIAVHAWDIHGARRAGLRTGWASRLEGRFPAAFDRPDVEAVDLVAVVDGLLA